MSAPAPGWYADATDPALIRWWDGSSWTDHTQPNPAHVAAAVPAAVPGPASLVLPPMADAAPQPTPAAPSAPRSPGATGLAVSAPVRLVPPASPFAASVSAPTGSVAASTAPAAWTASGPNESVAAVSPAAPGLSQATPGFAEPAPMASAELASVDYEPMVRSWGGSRSGAGQRAVTGVSTGGGWMLALSPLLQLALLSFGWVLTAGGTAPTTLLLVSIFGAVYLVWILLATLLDFRRLGALGHEYRPSVAWILLGPLMYLVARAIHVYRTTGRGVAPTWVFVIVSALVGAVVSVIGTLLNVVP